MEETRRQVLEGRIELPRIGEVRQADPSTGAPFAVVVNGNAEAELLVGWLRCAANPQRRRADLSAPQPGSVNVRTGKPLLVAGYAASTINHALTVISEFYEFHLLYGRGPLLNPVPSSPGRRRWVEYRLACVDDLSHFLRRSIRVLPRARMRTSLTPQGCE